MRNGNWQFNAEGIMFRKNGTLANGQHRLSAVVLANIPVRMLLIYGLSNDVVLFDRGIPRSTKDTLMYEGFDRKLTNTIIISTAKMHFAEQKRRRDVSDLEIRKFLIRNSNILVKISSLFAGGSKTQTQIRNAGISLATFYAMNSNLVTENQIEDFIRILKTGIPDDINQTPPLILKNDITSHIFYSLYPAGAKTRKMLLYATEKAIYDFVCGYKRMKTYSRTSEGYYSKMECNINA